MDYKDHQAARSDFWFRAKKDLLNTLMSEVYHRNARQPLRILNVGAGTGDDVEILNQYGEVYVVDISPEALALVPSQWCADKRVADACKLPYTTMTFDVVVALDVLEHIHDDNQAVAEIYRVLKNEGQFLVTVPAHQWLFSSRDHALEHKRRYSKKTLQTLLSPFSHTDLTYWNSLLFFPIACQRLLMKKSKPRIESIQLPAMVNQFLYRVLSVDTTCVRHRIPLPFGISLVAHSKR